MTASGSEFLSASIVLLTYQSYQHIWGQMYQYQQWHKNKKMQMIPDYKKEQRLKRAYPVQRAPTLCGVWGRVLVASLTLAYAMRGDRDYKFD